MLDGKWGYVNFCWVKVQPTTVTLSFPQTLQVIAAYPSSLSTTLLIVSHELHCMLDRVGVACMYYLCISEL